MAKRKKAAPRVRAGSTKKLTEKLVRDGINVEHLKDLDRTDPTHVAGKDPDKFYYYGLEKDIEANKAKGFVVSDNVNLKATAPGDGKVWKAEGRDALKGGHDLVLMEMPMKLKKAREQLRANKRAERDQAMALKQSRDATKGIDSEVASLFTPTDKDINFLDRD